jgi:hypothetical protein
VIGSDLSRQEANSRLEDQTSEMEVSRRNSDEDWRQCRRRTIHEDGKLAS